MRLIWNCLNYCLTIVIIGLVVLALAIFIGVPAVIEFIQRLGP